MKMPWRGKTGLSKATTFFATLLLVSLGLCGANFVSVILFVPIGGGNPPPPSWRDWIGNLLGAAAYTELAGILIGIIGLVIVALVAIVRAISGSSSPSSDEEKPE